MCGRICLVNTPFKTVKALYRCGKLIVGLPHSVSILIWGNVIALVHTHPNGNTFSKEDKANCNKYKLDNYVATPNGYVLKYNYRSKNTTTIYIMSYRHLSSREDIYEKELAKIWTSHFSCYRLGCSRTN